MKANELRIGNLVKIDCPDFENKIQSIPNIHEKGVLINGNPYSLLELQPILLTEEWLLRFGFVKWEDRLTIEAWAKGHPSQRFDIDFIEGEIVMNSRYQEHSDTHIMGHIKHVHQLQNLYFALTGEELKLKDDENN